MSAEVVDDMFTGIVEELGTVKGISKKGVVTLLSIQAEKVLEGIKIGDSVAVNGVCLTVIGHARGSVHFEMMPETGRGTNLGYLRMSERVNLERSLKVGDRISGHFVSGHIDCMGVIRRKGRIRGNVSFDIALPSGNTAYYVPKGSIAVDGISLTIAEAKSDTVRVYIIPHTMQNTTLLFKGPSDRVNIEFDMLLKRSGVRT